MPAGKPWLRRPYRPQMVPTGDYFHVFRRLYAPNASNPFSEGRFALASKTSGKPSEHGMFYVATTRSAAVWEVPLRDVQPEDDGSVSIPPSALEGLAIAQLRLTHANVPLVDLRQPALRAMFPDPNEAAEAFGLCTTGNYSATHQEAWALREELASQAYPMPFLAWPSRMHSTSTVFLGYEPPMEAHWWQVVGVPVDLDGKAGHALVREILAETGYTWVQTETDATEPEDDEDE